MIYFLSVISDGNTADENHLLQNVLEIWHNLETRTSQTSKMSCTQQTHQLTLLHHFNRPCPCEKHFFPSSPPALHPGPFRFRYKNSNLEIKLQNRATPVQHNSTLVFFFYSPGLSAGFPVLLPRRIALYEWLFSLAFQHFNI